MDELLSIPSVSPGSTRMRLVLGLAMGAWILLVGMSLLLNWLQAERSAMDMALSEARSSFNKDLVYRRWATMHGGVYVPPTEKTPPNPYLATVPDRDVETTTGRKLTLVNPAYMTRQVHELGQQYYGTRGHITSLNPIRQENAADEWETKALQAFEAGTREFSSLVDMEGQPFMRFMRPMITETGCLKCHAAQGYRQGDIRGGISVSVPFQLYLETVDRQQKLSALGHGLIGLLGLLGLWLGGGVLSRSQAALREGRERLEMVVHGASLGTWDWNIATGKLSFNDHWAGLLGYTPGELEPHIETWKRLVHPEDLPCLEELLNAHLEGRTDSFESEHRLRHRSGVWVWVFSKGRGMERNVAGRVLRTCGTCLDVTQRKKSQQALQLHVAIMETVAEGIFLIGVEDNIIKWTNRKFEEMFGYAAGEMAGMHVDKVNAPTELSPAETRVFIVERLLRQGDWDGEIQNIKKDGTVFWCHIHVSLFDHPEFGRVMVSAHTDITERKQAEEALRESEEKFSLAFQTAPYAMTITSAGDGRFIEVNDAFISISGFTRKEAIDRSSLQLNLWVDEEERARVVREILSGRKVMEEELLFRRKNGEILNGLLSADLMMIKNSPCVLSTIEDITDQKKAEKERENLQSQLLQAQKMESVGRLAGGVAHDFNNLLQVINGYTEMLMEEEGEESPLNTRLQEVSKAGKRAAALVGQLLAFSRRQLLRLENLDMNEVMAHLLKMLGRLIGEHIRLDFIPGHRLGMVYADRGMMEQVLVNLCINARDAMPDGGTLTLETQNVSINGGYCETHLWASPGHYVLVTVADTGIGMDRETLDRAFEPFFTTKPQGQGTGLGLATVYGIVKQHRGMIHAYSELKKGTVFKVYLPIVERLASEVEVKIQPRVVGGDETLLLAEDDETVRKLSADILEKAGYRVLLAKDGEEALLFFRKNASEVDMLILDVVMPGLGGRAVYEKACEIKRNIPVLFASGYAENAIHNNFVLGKGLRLVQKPFSSEELLRAVRETLDAGRTPSSSL